MKSSLIASLLFLSVAGSVVAGPLITPSGPTPESLGWKAGEVAPSPLVPRYSDPRFKTKAEAVEAKRVGEEELQRCAKIRLHQTALCNEKIFVNRCMGNAEKVLREREQIAHQLIRTADHQIRIFTTNERRNNKAPSRNLMPKKRGDIEQKIEKSNQKLTAQQERKLQEKANVEAYNQKLEENEARKVKLAQEAATRKADREARQARYEKERQKREEAQRRQAENNQSNSFF